MTVKKDVIKLRTLDIPPHGMHLIIKVKINNKVARLVVDTGASQTVLDKNRISRFVKEKKFTKSDGHTSGIGAKKMESHLVSIKKFEAGKIVLKDLVFVLLDLINVNASYHMINEKPVDGVLGGDILKELSAIINYKKRDITLILLPF